MKVNKTLVDSTNGNYYADYASGYRGTQVGPNEILDSRKALF